MIKSLLPIIGVLESLNLVFFNDNLVMFQLLRNIKHIKEH